MTAYSSMQEVEPGEVYQWQDTMSFYCSNAKKPILYGDCVTILGHGTNKNMQNNYTLILHNERQLYINADVLTSLIREGKFVNAKEFT
jgi:hypothetical protein